MGLFGWGLIAVLTIATLFAVALWGDRKGVLSARPRALVYGLSLGVYFTSWTFYGAVGSASANGWDYLPIYLGPLIAFTIGFPLVRRLLDVGRDLGALSVADFLSHRYGKSAIVGATASLIAVVGALPYIALQLTSIRDSLQMASGRGLGAGPLSDLAVAGALALFAILFGARRVDAAAHNRGLVLAIAGETVLKLLALLAIAVFAVSLSGVDQIRQLASAPDSPFMMPFDMPRFLVITALAFCAILCLPRQYQMMVVECEDRRDMHVGRWVFIAALLVTALVVPPIALTGLDQVGSGAPADMYMLSLPMTMGADLLALVVFAGGVAAATGMVIVSVIALSLMVTNDMINAARLRLLPSSGPEELQSGKSLLIQRRLVILAILFSAWVFSVGVTSSATLASLGLLAFAAAAQFAPALIGGLYWRSGNRIGALAGMGLGALGWLLFLALPAYGVTSMTVTLGALDGFTTGTMLSLGLNITAYVVGSALSAEGVMDRLQARRIAQPPLRLPRLRSGTASVADLKTVVEHSLGTVEGKRALAAFVAADGQPLDDHDPISPELKSFAERQIARVLGASSAQVVLSAVMGGGHTSAADLTLVLGAAQERVRFSHSLLEATLDNMTQGVAVIDSGLNMVAWNRAYLDLFAYPEGFIRPGIPVASVIRFNAARGLAGTETVDNYVNRRLNHYRAGQPYRFERLWTEGRTLQIEGNPLPGGGYVTTFTDVTDQKNAEEALKQTADILERRVAERTQALSDANTALNEARQAAEAATQSKTRFLAAASHDLMQPLNAARLFASALDGHVDAKAKALLPKLDQSIANADQLIRTLLNISKLDAGGLTPEPAAFPLGDLFNDLTAEFEILAEEKGLALTVMPTRLWVETDRGLLQSVLQNFLSNAIRYTREGRVLVGARARGDRVEIQVLDTGPGIRLEDRKRIFEEFARGDRAARADKGLGLGLAITRRISELLTAPLRLDGKVGHGSLFSISIERSDADKALDAMPPALPQAHAAAQLKGRRILCVDNDRHILDGEQALLERWGCDVALASSVQEALSLYPAMSHGPDLVLLDYHLDDGVTGLDAYGRLSEHLGHMPPALLITGDRAAATMDALPVLRKPIDASALRAEMERLLN